MIERTCAACDCKLEGEVISVKIGGKTVEVCCGDCADSVQASYAGVSDQSG
jgi:hypothetical protein